MHRLVLYVLFFLVGIIHHVFSQDVGFSQFYANQLYLNPAFAGSIETSRFFLGYRNQYTGTINTYVTYFASFDKEFEFIQGGMGFFVMNDVQANGLITKASAGTIYSYKMEVSRDFILRAGFQVAYVQKLVHSSELVFSDMIDINTGGYTPSQENFSNQAKGYADFGTGILGSYENIYGGVSVNHLTRPNESYNNSYDVPVPLKYTLHVGVELPLLHDRLRKVNTTISPNLLYQQQRNFMQVNYGLYITHIPITIGAWLRQDLNFRYDSFVILAGYSYMGYSASYSYDLSVSGVRVNNKKLGTHEVTFSIDFEYNSKRKKVRAIKCPKF